MKFLDVLSNLQCCVEKPEYGRGVATGIISGSARNRRIIAFAVMGRKMRMRFPSFIAQYRSIFVRGEYETPFQGEAPQILDLGANVGMSVLYFKLRYPKAAVTAIEADPELFEMLEENVRVNGLESVTLHRCAIWINDGEVGFVQNGLGGGSIGFESDGSSNVVVPCADAARFFEGRRFDIIKMDIEGSETAVIPRMRATVRRARFVIFEYHSSYGKEQELGNLLTILQEDGFHYYIRSENAKWNPYRGAMGEGAFDNHLVVYARKSGP